jgi:hypothetical protein
LLVVLAVLEFSTVVVAVGDVLIVFVFTSLALPELETAPPVVTVAVPVLGVVEESVVEGVGV